MSIIQGCIFVIAACTWTVPFLNVPFPEDYGWTRRLSKVRWALVIVLFPKFILTHAFMGARTRQAVLTGCERIFPVKFEHPSLMDKIRALWKIFSLRHLKTRWCKFRRDFDARSHGQMIEMQPILSKTPKRASRLHPISPLLGLTTVSPSPDLSPVAWHAAQ